MTLPFIIKAITWRNSFFIQPFPLVIGPLLYLYLRSFKERITLKKAWPHFIPFLVFFFPVYFHIDNMAKKYPGVETLTPQILRNPFTMVLMYTRLAHLLIYYILSRKELKSYQRSIKHLFSETSHINLGWASLLINGYLCLVLAGIIVFPLMFQYPERSLFFVLIMMAVSTPYIYIVTVKGMAQPSLWQVKPELKKEEVEKEFLEVKALETHKMVSKNEKPLKLADEKIDGIVRRVIGLMEDEKLYHEAELTLQQLANKLQLPTYLVSQAINEGLNKNFYELINNYRVEEAKQLLVHPKNSNFTILSIGFEAGFNSKTTFNTVFKKFTGLTPTEYREKQKYGAAVA